MKYVRFDLPPFDEEKTREAVEDALGKALFYKLTDIDREEVKMIAAYGDAVSESQRSNVTTDSTARAAINNVTKESERSQHIFRIEKAVSRLSRIQRKIITARYLTEFGIYDQDVYLDMVPMAPKTFRKHRTEAFYFLAVSLGVYVEKKPPEEKEGV